jgi:hypothetical protein
MSTTYERELREYEENISDFWKSIELGMSGLKSKNITHELCTFILKRFDTLVKTYIGIEWELQGSIPTEACKGKAVKFTCADHFDSGSSSCIIGINKNELKSIADKYGLYRLYIDTGNLEFSSSPVEATQYNLENSFVGVNEAVLGVLKLLEEKHSVPVGLFLPNSYVESQGEYVSKHVNISVFIKDPLEKTTQHNPKKWKRSDLINIKYIGGKDEVFLLGGKKRMLVGRIHINVPYNFRLYINLTKYAKGVVREQLQKAVESRTDLLYGFIIKYAHHYYSYENTLSSSELFLSILTYELTQRLKELMSENIELFMEMNEQQYGIQEGPTLVAYIRPHGKPVLVNPVY